MSKDLHLKSIGPVTSDQLRLLVTLAKRCIGNLVDSNIRCKHAKVIPNPEWLSKANQYLLPSVQRARHCTGRPVVIRKSKNNLEVSIITMINAVSQSNCHRILDKLYSILESSEDDDRFDILADVLFHCVLKDKTYSNLITWAINTAAGDQICQQGKAEN